MSGLPQELIDHIIDHVNDEKTLKACSLVCSQWSPRSRKHLFAQIELTVGDLRRWCARTRSGSSGPSSLIEVLTVSEHHPSSTSSLTRLHSSILADAASHFQSFSALRALKVRRWRGMSVDCALLMLRSFGSSLEKSDTLDTGGCRYPPFNPRDVRRPLPTSRQPFYLHHQHPQGARGYGWFVSRVLWRDCPNPSTRRVQCIKLSGVPSAKRGFRSRCPPRTTIPPSLSGICWPLFVA